MCRGSNSRLYEATHHITTKCFFLLLPQQCVSLCVCVCVFVVIPFILEVRVVDAPAGITQEEGHIGFLIHLPSAVLALIFHARRRPFPSSTVKSNVVYPRTNRSPLVGHVFFFFYRTTIQQFCDFCSRSLPGTYFLKKNLNASRPSEYITPLS